MSYINTDNDNYPVPRSDIEAALPNAIWADSAPPAPYAAVLEALSPPTPGAGEVLVEGGPELVSGVWRKTWTVEDAPVVIPVAVTQLQFRRALRHFGIYDAVVAYVATQNAETQEAFDYASMVRRDSPSLNAGADALLEEAAQPTLDAVFVYAGNVVE